MIDHTTAEPPTDAAAARDTTTPLPVAPAVDVAASPASCANCGAPLVGRYCAQCGQRAESRMLSVRAIVRDAIEDQLSLDASLPRTALALLLHPGLLTREYVAGRIRRYIPPMRLYLSCSVLYFLTMAALPGAASDVNIARPAPAAPSARAARAAAAESPSSPYVSSVTIRVGGISRFTVDTVGLPQWLHGPVIRVVDGDRRLQRMEPRQARALLVSRLADALPRVVFVLLPVFALLLKLLYIRRRRLFVEHFVFALHVHALAFLLFTALLVVQVPAGSLIALLVLAAYILRALRVVYGQGWLRTSAKFGLLAFAYLVFILLGLGFAVMMALGSLPAAA